MNKKNQYGNLYDRSLFLITLYLTIVGFIVMTSASIPIAEKIKQDPLFFAKNQAIYLFISFLAFFFILNIPMIYWKKYSSIFFVISFFLLGFVFFYGYKANGAARWIDCKLFHVQPSEIMKLSLSFYISNYLDKKNKNLNKKFYSFFKLIFFLILTSIFLLLQPDFGTIIILIIMFFSLLFISGSKFLFSVIFFNFFVISIFIFFYFKSYFLNRIVSFFDPWIDPFGSGYQLTQSLMAFGRGKIFGEGLGNSIHKLEYLPEAHTDFIFSILAEELGLFGAIFVIFMLFFIIFRAMIIGKQALDYKKNFSGYSACAIGIWIGSQVLINIGVSVGIFPTKGLTLPFISYGGSSLFVIFISISILLRIDFETRFEKIQAFKGRIK